MLCRPTGARAGPIFDPLNNGKNCFTRVKPYRVSELLHTGHRPPKSRRRSTRLARGCHTLGIAFNTLQVVHLLSL